MRYSYLILAVFLVSCSQAPVRSTVDSFGDRPIERQQAIYFEMSESRLLDQQAARACEEAAQAASLKIVNQPCEKCLTITVEGRMAGTQQVIRASPGYGSSWGVFGTNSGAGLGIATHATSSQEAGRELTLRFYEGNDRKKPMREIQLRSVGRENSVSAVAYEMCQAAFQEYPQNIEGKFYEIKRREKAKQ